MYYNFGIKLYCDKRTLKIVSAKSKILAFVYLYDFYRSHGDEPPTMDDIVKIDIDKRIIDFKSKKR